MLSLVSSIFIGLHLVLCLTNISLGCTVRLQNSQYYKTYRRESIIIIIMIIMFQKSKM